MVCLCGRSIDENLLGEKYIKDDRKLNFASWKTFAVDLLQDKMLSYPTFRRMINALGSDASRGALNLLRSRFLGFLGFVKINNDDEKKQADFLVSEGVLHVDEVDDRLFKLSSAYIDGLIRRYTIPKVYPCAPQAKIPRRTDGSLNFLEALKIAIRLFDKSAISRASVHSYKKARVQVDGIPNQDVPRESTYDIELNRILISWISLEGSFSVATQWHIINPRDSGGSYHRYTVITSSEYQRIVIELLATATQAELNEHFSRALEYAELINAGEAWIVHFTREYNAILEPCLASGEQLAKNLNVVHLWHDREFNVIRGMWRCPIFWA